MLTCQFRFSRIGVRYLSCCESKIPIYLRALSGSPSTSPLLLAYPAAFHVVSNLSSFKMSSNYPPRSKSSPSDSTQALSSVSPTESDRSASSAFLAPAYRPESADCFSSTALRIGVGVRSLGAEERSKLGIRPSVTIRSISSPRYLFYRGSLCLRRLTTNSRHGK